MPRRRPDPDADASHKEAPPLEDLFSLTIEDTLARTGWNETLLYHLIKSGRPKSYTLGRRRFVDAQSLRELIAERIAAAEAVAPEPRFAKKPAAPAPKTRQPRNAPGRWDGSRNYLPPKAAKTSTS